MYRELTVSLICLTLKLGQSVFRCSRCLFSPVGSLPQPAEMCPYSPFTPVRPEISLSPPPRSSLVSSHLCQNMYYLVLCFLCSRVVLETALTLSIFFSFRLLLAHCFSLVQKKFIFQFSSHRRLLTSCLFQAIFLESYHSIDNLTFSKSHLALHYSNS